MRQHIAPVLSSIFLCIAFNTMIASVAHGQTSPNKERKISQFGDIKIYDFDTSRGKADLSGVVLSGSKTTIEVPDKKSRSIIIFHANQISIQKQKKDIEAIFKGNLHFHVVQKVHDGGARILDGTSGAGSYTRSSQLFHLKERVHLSILDSAKIEGAGVLESDSFIVDMSNEQTVYHMAGDAGTSSIHFKTPPGNTKTSVNKNGSSEVYLRAFDAGTLILGDKASIQGDRSRIEITQSSDHSYFSVQASNIGVELHGDGDTISKSTASGSVKLGLVRNSKSGDKEIVDVKCGTSEYNFLEHKLNLHYAVSAVLTSPETLRTPARLTSEVIFATFGDLETYRMEGEPAVNRIVVDPIPAKPRKPEIGSNADQKPQKPIVPSTLTISNFSSGVFTPGVEAELVGANSTLLSELVDHSSTTQLQASKITVVLAEDNSIEHANAVSHVRFRVTQLPPPPGVKKTVVGTAESAVYTNGVADQQILVNGPIRATYTDPENLVEPGIMQGMAGDTLHLLFGAAGLEYELESENQTATIQFTPREKSPDEANKSSK